MTRDAVSMYGYEWFTAGGLEQLRQEACRRCCLRRFPAEQVDADPLPPEVRTYAEAVIIRVFVVVRDGVQYCMRAVIEVTDKLIFEVEPPGAKERRDNIVVSLPLADVARVEVQAVHPDDDRDELGMSGEIGFRARQIDRRGDEGGSGGAAG